MKKFLFLLVILLSTACKKDASTSTATLNEIITPASTTISMGDFTGGTVTGTAKVYEKEGKYTLAFENFSTAAGPDLHVYLSKEASPSDFIDMGKLQSTNGNQLYPISGMPDFKIYKFALIHCQQYNHLFGTAELKK